MALGRCGLTEPHNITVCVLQSEWPRGKCHCFGSEFLSILSNSREIMYQPLPTLLYCKWWTLDQGLGNDTKLDCLSNARRVFKCFFEVGYTDCPTGADLAHLVFPVCWLCCTLVPFMCTGVEVDAFPVVCFEVVICSGFTLFVGKSGVKLQLTNCLQDSDSHLQISPKTWWRLGFSWKLTLHVFV